MLLFLIEDYYSIDLITTMKQYEIGKDIIVCLNYSCYSRLIKEKSGHYYVFIEDLFDKKDYEELYQLSEVIAEKWYKFGETDHTFHGGISFGQIVSIKFFRDYMLLVLIKYGEIIRKALNKWPKINCIYYNFYSSEFNTHEKENYFNKQEIVHLVAHQLNLEAFSLKNKKGSLSHTNTSKKVASYKKIINRNVVHMIEKTIAIINNIFHFSHRQKPHVYFFACYNHRKLFDHLSSNLIVSTIGLSSSIRGLFSFAKKIFFSGGACLDFERVKYNLTLSEKEYLQSLRYKLFNQSCELLFKDIDYSAIYKKIIDDIVINIMPCLVAFVGKVRKGIQKNNIKTIIVNDEINEKSKAVLSAAHMEGIQSLFLDHGMPSLAPIKLKYDGKLADTVVCSGKYFEEHYPSIDNKKRKYIALGSPIMDLYPSNKRKRISNIKNALFLSCLEASYARINYVAYQEKYYKEIFSIFNELHESGIEIYYKPHPGESKKYQEYLMKIFKINLKNIHYIDNMPFMFLIYEMDLLISNASSCYLESLAAGVPAIFFDPYFMPDSLMPPLNRYNTEEVIRLTTGKELLELILNNKDNPSYLNDFLDNFLEKYAPLYMGNLDGMASKRIIEFVCNKKESLTDLLYKTTGNF